jgi:AcrR family transcriptional regulator
VRNAEATQERILQAAMAEFSAHGVAGARVDRIATAAGCNKNLIYIYFESKESLFTTVLEKNLLRVHEDLPFTPEDLPGYATRVFDFAMTNPDLMRLIAWSSLEQKADSSAARTAALDVKVAALAQAQADGLAGPVFPPAFLLTAVMTLATAWTATNPFGPSVDPESARNPAELRECVAAAVELISDARLKED